jgi:hypothetical protein
MRVVFAFLIASTLFASPQQWCDHCVRDANGRIHRSSAARYTFRRDNPCPATGETRGTCPGYVIDRIKPLACGGADEPSNMQWQTRKAAAEKDRWERQAGGGQ